MNGEPVSSSMTINLSWNSINIMFKGLSIIVLVPSIGMMDMTSLLMRETVELGEEMSSMSLLILFYLIEESMLSVILIKVESPELNLLMETTSAILMTETGFPSELMFLKAHLIN